MAGKLLNPFVVQCSGCRLIVADSFSLVDRIGKDLVFTGLSSNAVIRDFTVESHCDSDFGCLYKEVVCPCGGIVGRKYVTVNDSLRDCVGRYLIDGDRVVSYELGHGTSCGEISLGSIAEEVNKLQRFCVALHNKIYGSDKKS